MKTLLIIKTHSFVDVITNSSTELFVCDDEKTLEEVKNLLQEKWKLFRELYDGNPKEDVFDILNVELVDKKYMVKVEEARKGEWGYWLDGYGVSTKDGDVHISGNDDNSIPYEFWDVIEKLFNTTRYHLG